MIVKGKAYFICEITPHKRDNEFTGFNTKAEGNGTNFHKGIKIEKDTVFYSVYKENEYS